MSHTPTPQYPSRSQTQSRLTPSQIRQQPISPSDEDLSSRISAMSIGHHQYPQSQGHLQQQQQGNAPPPPTAQPQPFSSLHAPALYGLHDYPTNLNVNVNPYYTSASAPGSAGYSNFPAFESAGNSPVATTFQQYGSDHQQQGQGQGQGMVDIYGNPQNPGRRVYGGIVPRRRGDSVSTTITNGNVSTPYGNGNGQGHGNGYGGGYGGEESVPSSPMSMTSGMMSQYYGYGGGETYYPPAVGGYRGRGKPVSLSLRRSLQDRANLRLEDEQTDNHTGTTITTTSPWDRSDHQPPPTSTIRNIMAIHTLISWLGRCPSNMVFIRTTPPESGGVG
jgi:hypothetical protein